VVLNQNDLRVHPGRSFAGPVWAILTESGAAFSLVDWTVQAQVRTNELDPEVFAEFTVENGRVVVGQAPVTSPADGTTVTTATIQLILGSNESRRWPRLWLGQYDVRIGTADPDVEDYTIIPTAGFLVVGGPTT
jgi:hypothetical protein